MKKSLTAGLATFTWCRRRCTVNARMMDEQRETWTSVGTGPTRERALAKALKVPAITFAQRDTDLAMCLADNRGEPFRFIAINGSAIAAQ